jgi:hypothetical protein
MLPAVMLGSIGVVAGTFRAISLGSAAGTGYALGRKYGRIACEYIERFENVFIQKVKSKITVEE